MAQRQPALALEVVLALGQILAPACTANPVARR